MRAKWITGLVVAALLILAGIFWFVRYQSRSGSIHEPVAVKSTSGRQVKTANRVVPVSSVFSSSVTGHVRVAQSAGSMQVDSVPENAAVEDARLKRIEAGVDAAEIPAALEFLQARGDAGNEGKLTGELVRQWAESDVEQAAEWVEKMPAGEVRQRAVKDVVTVWADKDAAEALRWVRNLPEGEDRDGALISVAYEIVRTNSVLAMEVAVGLPASSDGDALIKHIALQWAGGDPEGAAQWAEDLPAELLKDRVQANIATAWGEKDPVHAAQYAVFSIKPGRAQDDAVVAIVQRWVQVDPDAAATWVQAFPEGVLSETAAENIVKLWPGGFPDTADANR